MKPAVKDNIFKLDLTPREKIAAAMFALGATRKELARRLFISENTAVTHAKNIYNKTGCHNLADLTRNVIAEALRIPVQKIDNAIKNYALEVGIARIIFTAFFLAINVYIIYIETDELARARGARKESKTKGSTARKKDTYYV